jgi:carotenoid cleavage dioxygenase
MPRASGPVRWFDVDPCFVYHVANAHEDQHGRVVLDAARYGPDEFRASWSGMGGTTDGPGTAGGATLHRWVLDPATGTVTEGPLDDRAVEFPTHDDELTGLGNRYVYAVSPTAIVKYDVVQEKSIALELDSEFAPGEAVFVPASDRRGEDEGWLLSLVSDRSGKGTELLVLDATDLSRTASVTLPRRVPAGFHGSWIPDSPH